MALHPPRAGRGHARAGRRHLRRADRARRRPPAARVPGGRGTTHRGQPRLGPARRHRGRDGGVELALGGAAPSCSRPLSTSGSCSPPPPWWDMATAAHEARLHLRRRAQGVRRGDRELPGRGPSAGRRRHRARRRPSSLAEGRLGPGHGSRARPGVGVHGLRLRVRRRPSRPPTTPSTSTAATASCSSTTCSSTTAGPAAGRGSGVTPKRGTGAPRPPATDPRPRRETAVR